MFTVTLTVEHQKDGRTYADTIDEYQIDFTRLISAAKLFETLKTEAEKIGARADAIAQETVTILNEIPEDVDPETKADLWEALGGGGAE